MSASFHFRKNRALVYWLLALTLALVPSISIVHAEDEEESDVLESIEDEAPSPDKAEALADAVDADAAGDDESLDDLEKLVADEPVEKVVTEVPTGKVADVSKTAKSDEDTVNDMLDELVQKSEPEPTKVREVAPQVAEAPARRRATASNEPANQLTNVEFREEGETTRIVVSSRNRLAFREEKNPTLRQVVYYFEATETPQRLQRAYDTTEFASPVSLFTVFQLPGEERQSKMIVQLRDDKYPVVTASDTNLILDFPKVAANTRDPKLVVGQDDQAIEDNIYATGKTFSGKRIAKLELKNTEVQDAIRLIAKTSGYNIVVGDDVSGRVGTLSLENVPWDQAFTLLLQSRRLGYIRQGNVLRVATLASLTAEKNEALANEASRVRVEPLRTVLIPVSYARAADIAVRGKPFTTERGTIDVDTRTNTVIVRDVQASIDRVQKLIAALDTQPPTVSISGKFVEMTQNFSRNIGFRSLSFNPTLAGISFENSVDLGNPGGNLVSTIRAPDFANFQAQLHLGESDNKVKILANPTVSVIANNPATVTHGITQFVRTTETVNGVTNTIDRPVVANLALTVTPIVSGDGSIFLTVNITNDVPRTTSTGSLAIDTRNVNTQVLIENGDTVVIGGVFKDQVNTTNTGVPFLNKIPIVSFFFSRSAYEGVRSELFIFLTAKVLNAEASFRRAG